jgi:hypothetical protein
MIEDILIVQLGFPDVTLSIKINEQACLVSASPPLLSFDERNNGSRQSSSLGSCPDLRNPRGRTASTYGRRILEC